MSWRTDQLKTGMPPPQLAFDTTEDPVTDCPCDNTTRAPLGSWKAIRTGSSAFFLLCVLVGKGGPPWFQALHAVARQAPANFFPVVGAVPLPRVDDRVIGDPVGITDKAKNVRLV